ncbi:AAA15 family ATPase/GTPase [Sporomusaceae bacterium BoRhaA]|uniref:AAA family ATPase n=1 Tax=Pelorhabdus rhamnosifermentans TaxID=2772457 RepID=UPI001C05FCCF|nr:ATP-binding protein [Pelorhabdus rhamnosifermentans]MBU2704018.1 AAA15 family ATPase/GTPase [Pelorhabdus rhamnosifermentans]
MLIQFNFKNFRSFRDEVTLDLSATQITEHANSVIAIGNEKLLPVVAIYGANASGKSNVYAALEYMAYYVSQSFQFGGDSDSKQKQDSHYVKPTPFLFDSNSRDAESSFEVYFIDTRDNLKTYNYGFCVNQDGVTEEWLNSKTKTAKKFKKIFYRSKDELDLDGLPSKSKENIEIALEKEVLIVSLGAKLKIAKLKVIRDWFYSNEFTNFGDPGENYFRSKLLPDNFVKDKEVQSNVLEYFASFDESIKGFNIEEDHGESAKDKKGYKIDTLHHVIGTEENTTIPLQQESDGTLKMFALYPSLQEVLENGSVLFVDELNARLHPLLVRNFILTFLNPKLNPEHAQLIFTTHDTWQLSNKLLRRDEIWFTEKDKNGISNIYSLVDFVNEDGLKIRKDESYEKNYLIGKYGAIPSLKSIQIFKEEIIDGKG